MAARQASYNADVLVAAFDAHLHAKLVALF
jgi:hypothetical protein